jgi:dipeptidyl aminopeptidase/acylaminoacyl peptidase
MKSTTKTLTAQDLLSFPFLSDAQISPDGAMVAYTQGEIASTKSKTPTRHIRLVDANGKNDRQFSTGLRADFHPRWSPDGRQIAFLSDRAEADKLQIYLMSSTGGEAIQLTNVEGTIDTSRAKDTIQWSPDGTKIGFLMTDPETSEEKAKKAEKDDAIEFEKNHKFTRLWVIEVATRNLRQIVKGEYQVWEFAWSPNSLDIALVVSRVPYEWGWHIAQLALVKARGGIPKVVYNPSPRQIGLPRWSPDGKHVAFISMVSSDRGSIGGDVFLMAVKSKKVKDICAGFGGSVGWIEWKPSGKSLVFAAHENGEPMIGQLWPYSGRIETLWRTPAALAETHWVRFSVSKGRTRIAAIRSAPLQARDAWTGVLSRNHIKWKRVSDSVPQLRDYSLGEQEMFEWRGRDGIALRGILIKPVGHKPGKRYPLIVHPHGGPTSLYANGMFAFGLWGQLLAQRGYAVFLPNFRGSTGFGLKFTESNVGDLGGSDFQDIEAGVDALIEGGIADPGRLGIGGWSYGGFMACWAVTQTTRYKAAVMGAGISNWLSFHGNSHLHAWDAIHYNANPYEADGVYGKFSAMNYVSRVKTPTLILHGELDRDVPAEQGYQFYRALHDHGIPTEFVIYPREGHGINEAKHWLDLHRRIGEWYERFV